MAGDFQMKVNRENRRVLLKIRDLREMTHRNIRHGWFALAADLKRTVNTEILRRPKGGATYFRRIRGGSRRRHVASAPGETHANMTGAARKSLGWSVVGWKSMEFGYGVATSQPAPAYVGALEFGGRNAPRPSLQNGIKATNRNSTLYFTERFGK